MAEHNRKKSILTIPLYFDFMNTSTNHLKKKKKQTELGKSY